MRKNQHVVPHKEKWGIKGQGNKRLTKVTLTQREAIEIAKKIAKNQKSELFIHRKDGTIRERNSYGKDSIYEEG